MTGRFIAALVAFVLLVLAWLGFAFLMRDTPLITGILGWGLAGVIVVGYFLAVLMEPPMTPPEGTQEAQAAARWWAGLLTNAQSADIGDTPGRDLDQVDLSRPPSRPRPSARPWRRPSSAASWWPGQASRATARPGGATSC
ncbi:hypothetical protein DQ384_40120 [Sphaerisporangium album]|uniref:Uncharacterized protein n=1 Tax=Sphaerisporangium album TaxID=509200 RepID=A0A367EDQ5_9ACTN|nr:hypothetical protein [Sphaerisporangium album]RCG16208.1 hypothetical protein DQ384_40120 [Sphaerisporangium album]